MFQLKFLFTVHPISDQTRLDLNQETNKTRIDLFAISVSRPNNPISNLRQHYPNYFLFRPPISSKYIQKYWQFRKVAESINPPWRKWLYAFPIAVPRSKQGEKGGSPRPPIRKEITPTATYEEVSTSPAVNMTTSDKLSWLIRLQITACAFVKSLLHSDRLFFVLTFELSCLLSYAWNGESKHDSF